MSWIVDIDSTLASTTDPTATHTSPSSSSSSASSSFGGLLGLLAGMGIISSEEGGDSRDKDAWIIGDNIAELTQKRTSSPIDRCTGVQLHIIVSSPQDIVSGSHCSAPAASATPAGNLPRPLGMDPAWVRQMGKRCAHHGLGVNVWGVAAFEESYGSLQDLLPLVQCTGGQV